MNIGQAHLSQQFAALSFLMLYPAFFFYNAAIAFGYITPILGGLFGPYSLIVTSIYIIYIMSLAPRAQYARFQTIWIENLLYIFFGWTTFWITLNFLLNRDTYVDASSSVLWGIVIQLIANFAIGYYLNLEHKWFRVTLLLFLTCMLVFVLSTFDRDTLSVHGGLYYGDNADLVDPESYATYQGFARSTLLTSFLILAFMKNFTTRLLITAESTLILFLLSARSELVGFLFAVIVFEILLSIGKPGRIFALSSLGLFTAILVIFVGNLFLPDLSDSRVFSLGDLDRDSSWEIRKEFSRRAFFQILDNPLFGKFAGEYYEGLGQEGTYAHNILSAWVSLGLPGFLLYLSLLCGSFLVSLKTVLHNKGNEDLWNLALLTSITALLLSLTSKAFGEPWFGLVFGLVLKLSKQDSEAAKVRASSAS